MGVLWGALVFLGGAGAPASPSLAPPMNEETVSPFSNGRLHPPKITLVGCIRHKEDLILEY